MSSMSVSFSADSADPDGQHPHDTTALSRGVRECEDRVSSARARLARAEAERDSARARVGEVMDALEREFGVSTFDEAEAALADLKSRAAAELETTRGKLDQVENVLQTQSREEHR